MEMPSAAKPGMTRGLAVPAALIFLLLVALEAAARPQLRPNLLKEPDPSYREDAFANRRHPEVDTDVGLYINHWRNAIPRIGHGGLVERDILTRGDPQRPKKKGAVLKFISSYSRAVLQPRTRTVEFKNDKEQAFLYVTSGMGSLTSGRKTAALDEGTAVFVPAGVKYRLANDFAISLEMIFVTESIAAGFEPNAAISIGTYRDSEQAVGHHWAHVARGFTYDVPPKFSHPMGFAVVAIDAFDIAQPHTHPPGTEEIWLQLRGASLLLFGNRLLRQDPGEAFLVPPNNRVPHASINPTNEPMLWLFMGCRVAEDETKERS